MEISRGSPFRVMVFCREAMDGVGFTAARNIMGIPLLIPPRTPPAWLVAVLISLSFLSKESLFSDPRAAAAAKPYTFDMKYGFRDYRGGGRSSGRETIGRVAAGAVAAKILKQLGVTFLTYARSIGPVSISSSPQELLSGDLSELSEKIQSSPLYMPEELPCQQAQEFLQTCMADKDSAGGIIECIISDFSVFSFKRVIIFRPEGGSGGKAVSNFKALYRSDGKNSFCQICVQFFKHRFPDSDSAEILSGIFEGKTTGTPISLLVFNKDQHSKDYGEIANYYRPGHADYTFDMKYGFRISVCLFHPGKAPPDSRRLQRRCPGRGTLPR